MTANVTPESFSKSEYLATIITPQKAFRPTVVQLVDRQTQRVGEKFRAAATLVDIP